MKIIVLLFILVSSKVSAKSTIYQDHIDACMLSALPVTKLTHDEHSYKTALETCKKVAEQPARANGMRDYSSDPKYLRILALGLMCAGGGWQTIPYANAYFKLEKKKIPEEIDTEKQHPGAIIKKLCNEKKIEEIEQRGSK